MDAEYVEKIRAFFLKKGISTKGVAILTIQKNFTGEFSALVVDFDNVRILEHYPVMQDSYSEMGLGGFKIAFKAGLAQPTENQIAVGTQKGNFAKPFCCPPQSLVPFRERKIQMENVFDNFLSGSGNHPNIVFEVKCQIDNGPLLCTDYFKLEHGRIEQVYGNFTNKQHAFKNYKCPVHGLFYAVDLYNATDKNVRNSHHMRLNPFTKINKNVMDAFFVAAALNGREEM